MALVPQRRWIMPMNPGNVRDGIPALVAQVLGCRGISASDRAAFLAARPSEEGPPMLDLAKAVDRLRRALAARERIVVYGDYDVDGIAGSALLVPAFPQLGVAGRGLHPQPHEGGHRPEPAGPPHAVAGRAPGHPGRPHGLPPRGG